MPELEHLEAIIKKAIKVGIDKKINHLNRMIERQENKKQTHLKVNYIDMSIFYYLYFSGKLQDIAKPSTQK